MTKILDVVKPGVLVGEEQEGEVVLPEVLVEAVLGGEV